MQITTLVPAYKPKYLVEMLIALRHQTVKPAKIIISDDSPDQAFMTLLTTEPIKSSVADMKIQVVPGPRTGAYNNFRHLLRLYREQADGPTELFHLLLDDDIPYPLFYETHLQTHHVREVQCVVSRRWTALESGQPIRDLSVPPAIANHGQHLLAIEPHILFAHTVGMSANWLGEFSNATFRAKMSHELDEPSLGGICFTGLEDLGAFLKASLYAPVGYINDHLGYFRTSGDQHSANPMGRPLKLAHLAYIALAIAGRNLGQLTAQQCSNVFARVCPVVLHHYGQEPDMSTICSIMLQLAANRADAEKEFIRLWSAYVNN